MESKTKETYFLYTLLVAAFLLCIVIFRPFLPVIIIGGALAVVFYRPFVWLRSRLPGFLKRFAGALTVILFLIVLAIPLTFVGVKVVDDARALYGSVSSGGAASQYLNDVSATVHEVFPEISMADVKSKLGDAIGFLAGSLTIIFTSTLQTVFSFILIIFSLFYFLKDGERWVKYAVDISPLSRKRNEKLVQILASSINGVIAGYLFIAVIQGFLFGIGLWIFGVPSPALWGLIAGIASMIPTFGTALVSVPSVIYLLLTGNNAQAFGFATWALVLVGTVDNFLNPIIVGKEIKLPPFVVFFAVLGGIALLGAPGILIGPLAVSLLHALVQMSREGLVER